MKHAAIGFSSFAFPLTLLLAGVVAAQTAPPQRNIPAIAKASNGAIVSIVMSDKDGKPIAQGSGFLVSKDGVIVTNYHVISEGSSAIVKFPDGAFYVVDGVLAFDKARDVAVIKAHGQNFRTLTLGNSDRLQVGEEVVAIGNPLSLESTVSNGIVSGIRTVEEEGGKFLQVTTPISPGSSGGPLFNMAGEVVGITTLYLKGGENLNFAIPINDAKRLLLAKSSKIQSLPNETEPVKAQTHDGNAPPAAGQTTPSDRDYYQRLYDAGGFKSYLTAPDGSRVDVHVPRMDYVCFSDDAHSATFFTFIVIAYDENASKATNKLMKGEEVQEQMGIMHAIGQKVASTFGLVPRFIDSTDFESWPPDTQQYFRDGGPILKENIYEKGVKVNTIEYRWGGSSWFTSSPPADPNAYTKKSVVFYLSIEPTTMRYVESEEVTLTVGSGESAATSRANYGPSTGVCGQVPMYK